MLRLLNWLLGIVALAGGAMVAWDRPELTRLRAEQERLEELVGQLEVEERSKFAAVTIETGEPYHFVWRIYSPEDRLLLIATSCVDSGSSTLSSSLRGESESVIRSRFIFNDGSVRHFLRTPSGSMTAGMFGHEAANFLQEHWGKMQIEGVGFDGTQTFDPEPITDWLRITIPKELIPQAVAALGIDAKKLESQPLVSIRTGSPEAFEDEERRAAQRR